MKGICIKDVVMQGKTLFDKGAMYEFKETEDGFEAMSTYGLGVWNKKDKHLKEHFKLEGSLGFNKLKKKIEKGKKF